MWKFIASNFSGLRKLCIDFDILPCIRGTKPLEEFQNAWLDPLQELSQLDLECFEVTFPSSYFCYLSLEGGANRKSYRLLELDDRVLT